MGLELNYDYGQTPIDEDEKQDLLIATITTKSELDEFEQLNNEEAYKWVFSKSFKFENVFSEHFVKLLHKKMFGNVWAWAGKFRNTNKNLGVDKWQIASELKNLNDDTLFWIKNKIFCDDEIATRYKHRLVSIHCFPNGNGRHSRLIADLIIVKLFKKEQFTWGINLKMKKTEIRRNYIESLREADNNNYESLLKFARS